VVPISTIRGLTRSLRAAYNSVTPFFVRSLPSGNVPLFPIDTHLACAYEFPPFATTRDDFPLSSLQVLSSSILNLLLFPIPLLSFIPFSWSPLPTDRPLFCCLRRLSAFSSLWLLARCAMAPTKVGFDHLFSFALLTLLMCCGSTECDIPSAYLFLLSFFSCILFPSLSVLRSSSVPPETHAFLITWGLFPSGRTPRERLWAFC